MSDAQNGFGEALESMTTNTKQAIGGTIADFTKSAANQVKGSGGVSGSFVPGQQAPQNPNTAPSLQGGELFSPDKTQGQNPGQNQPLPKPLTQAGQQAQEHPEQRTPEEMAKIQKIEQELRGLHQQYYQDFVAKAEGKDKKAQEDKQEEAKETQEEQVKKMEDLQQKQKEDQDVNTFRAARGTELAKGNQG